MYRYMLGLLDNIWQAYSISAAVHVMHHLLLTNKNKQKSFSQSPSCPHMHLALASMHLNT